MQASSKRTLQEAVEAHITALVRGAMIVQRHSKRSKKQQPAYTIPCNDDTNKNQNKKSSSQHPSQSPSLPSSSSATANADIWLLPQDINMVLQWQGSDTLYTTNMNQQDTQNAVIQLNDFLQKEPSVDPSSEVTMMVHWLAVDGVQPKISMNPVAVAAGVSADHINRTNTDGHNARMHNHTIDKMTAAAAAAGPQNQTENSDIVIQHLLPTLLSEELQLYFHRITTLLQSQQTLDVYPTADHHHTHHTHTYHHSKIKRVEGYFMALHALQVDKGIQELIPFFIQFLIHTLIQCKGIQQLQPEWTCRGIRGILALLFNTHVHLDLHLHQILPMIFTCLVTKHLDLSFSMVSSSPCTSTSSTSSSTSTSSTTTPTITITSNSTHYEVRKMAGLCIYNILKKYSKDYTTIQPRVLKTLVDALTTHLHLQQQQQQHHGTMMAMISATTATTTTTSTSSTTSIMTTSRTTFWKHLIKTWGSGSTVYGALWTLAYLGSRVIDSFILPLACQCWLLWEQQSQTLGNYSEWIDAKSFIQEEVTLSSSQWKDLYFIQTYEIYMCQEVLLMNMGIFFRNVSVNEQEKRLDYEHLESVFGEKLIPLQGTTFYQEGSDYWTCFI